MAPWWFQYRAEPWSIHILRLEGNISAEYQFVSGGVVPWFRGSGGSVVPGEGVGGGSGVPIGRPPSKGIESVRGVYNDIHRVSYTPTRDGCGSTACVYNDIHRVPYTPMVAPHTVIKDPIHRVCVYTHSVIHRHTHTACVYTHRGV